MFAEFHETAAHIFAKAAKEGRLIRNPDSAALRRFALAAPEVRESRYGSLVAESEPTAIATSFTRNNVDTPFGQQEENLLMEARRRLAEEKLISLDVLVGDGSQGITARLLVPLRHAHVAYGGQKLFLPTQTDDPTYQVLMFFDGNFASNKDRVLPQKDVTVRLAFSPQGQMVKIVRNSNYFGEWKKGVFAGEDHRVKQAGDAIFLHAGCRKDTLETAHGPYRASYSLFVALSGTGKTSTTCKVLARKGQERSWLIQDDGGALTRDGRFLGYEGGGLRVKTEGLNPGEQLEAYYASLKPSTFLENVHVEPDGSFDFYNLERNSNGRAVVERRDFMHAGREINAQHVDNLFIITRGNIIPAVARLTHAQAAAYMVLGQSADLSAIADPSQAGKTRNVFFYDPYVAGSRAKHANLFYEILTANPHIQCYLLNTGWIGMGERMRDIRLSDTMGILDSVLRGGLEDWTVSERTGLPVPNSIRLADSILVQPERLFPVAEFRRRQQALHQQQAQFIQRIPDLHADIKAVFLQ